MNAKITQGLVWATISVLGAGYQWFRGYNWWIAGFVFTVFFPVLVDGIGERSKSRGGTGLPGMQRWLLLGAAAGMAGVGVFDGLRGGSWLVPVVLALILLFFGWALGLPDPEPPRQEPECDRDAPPQVSWEEALMTGSDADFTYFVNETFPWVDWKDPAEYVLEQFRPHIGGLGFRVRRDEEGTEVTVTLGDKARTFGPIQGPEAAELIEPLADFLSPEYLLCGYYFTEENDCQVIPVFEAALWDRLKEKRPDRAALFTPLVEHKSLSRGPRRR
jgi:hypothetical protein